MVDFNVPNETPTSGFQQKKVLRKTPYPPKEYETRNSDATNSSRTIDTAFSFGDEIAVEDDVETPTNHESSFGGEEEEWKGTNPSNTSDESQQNACLDDSIDKETTDVQEEDNSKNFNEDWELVRKSLMESSDSCEYRRNLEVLLGCMKRHAESQERVSKAYGVAEEALKQSLQRALNAAEPIYNYLTQYMDVRSSLECADNRICSLTLLPVDRESTCGAFYRITCYT